MTILLFENHIEVRFSFFHEFSLIIFHQIRHRKAQVSQNKSGDLNDAGLSLSLHRTLPSLRFTLSLSLSPSPLSLFFTFLLMLHSQETSSILSGN